MSLVRSRAARARVPKCGTTVASACLVRAFVRSEQSGIRGMSFPTCLTQTRSSAPVRLPTRRRLERYTSGVFVTPDLADFWQVAGGRGGLVANRDAAVDKTGSPPDWSATQALKKHWALCSLLHRDCTECVRASPACESSHRLDLLQRGPSQGPRTAPSTEPLGAQPHSLSPPFPSGLAPSVCGKNRHACPSATPKNSHPNLASAPPVRDIC